MDGDTPQDVQALDTCSGSWIDITSDFDNTWSTVSPSIATVDCCGTHHGVALGSTTTSAYAEEQVWTRGSYDCPVEDVHPGGSDNVKPEVSFSSISNLAVGQTATITATVTPSSNTTPISLSISGGASIVSPTGTFTTSTNVVVKGLTAGTATITATATIPDAGTVTVGSASFTVYTPVPTSLQIVSGTNIQSSGPCTTNSEAGCGAGRSFTYQVLDQFGNPLQQAGLQVWDSFGTPSPNPLNITGTSATTCSPPNTGPCGKTTNSSGQLPELGVGACSTVCYNSSTKMCVTGGPSVNTQTWHIGSASINQTISFYCDHVLVNGQ